MPALLATAGLAADAPKMTGKWQIALETPHGSRVGVLTVQQEGEKLSGACELEKHDPATMTGGIQGGRVSMKMELHGNAFTLVGTVEGDSMSGTTEPPGATWKATRKQVGLPGFPSR